MAKSVVKSKPKAAAKKPAAKKPAAVAAKAAAPAKKVAAVAKKAPAKKPAAAATKAAAAKKSAPRQKRLPRRRKPKASRPAFHLPGHRRSSPNKWPGIFCFWNGLPLARLARRITRVTLGLERGLVGKQPSDPFQLFSLARLGLGLGCLFRGYARRFRGRFALRRVLPLREPAFPAAASPSRPRASHAPRGWPCVRPAWPAPPGRPEPALP